MIRPQKETEDLVFSIIKNCEKPIKQSDCKPQKNDFYHTQPSETFPFKSYVILGLDFKPMIGLASLEAENSFFLFLAEENDKLDIYTDFLITF